MQTIPMCKHCKSTVFTLAQNPDVKVYTGYKLLKCMVCGSFDEPTYVKAYEGEAEIRKHNKRRDDIVYRYETLIEEWSEKWNLMIGKMKK